MYTGQKIPVKGSIQVEVEHGSERKTLSLVGMEGQDPNSLGRKWLRELRLYWKSTYRVLDAFFSEQVGNNQLHNGPKSTSKVSLAQTSAFVPIAESG